MSGVGTVIVAGVGIKVLCRDSFFLIGGSPCYLSFFLNLWRLPLHPPALPPFFLLVLTGDDTVDLFSAVDITSIVVVGLTTVDVAVFMVVVTAASTGFTADVLFWGLGFLPFSDHLGPPLFFVGVFPSFCFFTRFCCYCCCSCCCC